MCVGYHRINRLQRYELFLIWHFSPWQLEASVRWSLFAVPSLLLCRGLCCSPIVLRLFFDSSSFSKRNTIEEQSKNKQRRNEVATTPPRGDGQGAAKGWEKGKDSRPQGDGNFFIAASGRCGGGRRGGRRCRPGWCSRQRRPGRYRGCRNGP